LAFGTTLWIARGTPGIAMTTGARRWPAAVVAATAGAPVVPDRPLPLAGMPWDVAQAAMSAQAVVILVGVVQAEAVRPAPSTTAPPEAAPATSAVVVGVAAAPA
jgi:hypothetical protein